MLWDTIEKAPLFYEIQPSDSSEQIAETLTKAISIGVIGIGEYLPSEKELAAQFNCAIATLRKALQTLREQGIIKTVRGRSGGTFVIKTPEMSDTEISEALDRMAVFELRDLCEEHLANNQALVKLVCARATDEDLATLSELTDMFEKMDSSADRLRTGSRFHIQMAVVSQSDRLLRNEIRLQSEISLLLLHRFNDMKYSDYTGSDHRKILQALYARDADLAWKLLSEHIRKNIYQLIDMKLGYLPTISEPNTYTADTGKNIEAAALHIEELFNTKYSMLTRYGRTVAKVTEGTTTGGVPLLSRYPELAEESAKALTEDPLLEGIGVMQISQNNKKINRQLEWWVPADTADKSHVVMAKTDYAEVAKKTFNFNPSSNSCYEFEKLPWFTEPLRTEKPALTGPYLDYLGVEDYILTLTIPLHTRLQVQATVGCDITLRNLEKALLSSLRLINVPAVLASPNGRIILGNKIDYSTGDIITPETAKDWQRIPLNSDILRLYVRKDD